MSTINVTNLSGRGGATPNLPDGANITGVATATTFDGSLKSTGTPTLGLGVTINSSGLVVSGVATAGVGSFTTVYGDGSNLTGVGESIAPWYYNPDINDTAVTVGTGIGITFNKKINMGSSGTATLKMVNAGVAGTTIQSWGISSATQAAVTEITLGSLVSNLVINKTYQLDIPEGFVVSSTGTSYAGTAYTFTVQGAENKLFVWGRGRDGMTLQEAEAHYSSPVQVPSPVAWKAGWGQGQEDDTYTSGAVKTDGTLWMWGDNPSGMLGTNQAEAQLDAASSPVQVPGTTWSTVSVSVGCAIATKTDGTLWAWGSGSPGALGQNDRANVSSPVQIPGTTWALTANSSSEILATKTDGTLWAWGTNTKGRLGLNDVVQRSSPTQIPGTTWSQVGITNVTGVATKTDGTLWAWGENEYGEIADNTVIDKSSPVQIPGTTWALVDGGYRAIMATKTDGTLWLWGDNEHGGLGQNNRTQYSSPIQVPGTTWGTTQRSQIIKGFEDVMAIKTDGTLWTWGYNGYGGLGQNNIINYSSPVQVGSRTDWDQVGGFGKAASYAIQADETP